MLMVSVLFKVFTGLIPLMSVASSANGPVVLLKLAQQNVFVL